MSYKATEWVYQQALKGSRKAVLLVLAKHANEESVCWPGVPVIAEEAGYSRATVIVATNDLQRQGFITKTYIYNQLGKRSGIKYKLNLGLKPKILSSNLQPSEAERANQNPSIQTSETLEHSKAKQTKVNNKRSTIPNSFALSESLLNWGKISGYSVEVLKQHLEYFKTLALAKGYQYNDWDAAFKMAVKDNWAKISNGGRGELSFSRKWADEQKIEVREPVTDERRKALYQSLPPYLQKLMNNPKD